MASSSSFFIPNTPHFFKIILPRTLELGIFEVPKKFVRDHGECLLNNKVSLKVSDGGDQWEVELQKRNGKVWFGKGLKEFLEFYFVRFGYFIVFKYDVGDSCFNVVIFDMSASEIRYPFKNSHHHHKGKTIVLDDDDDGDDIIILDDDEDDDQSFKPNKKKTTVQLEPGSIRKKKNPLEASTDAIAFIKANSFKLKTKNPSFMVIMQPTYIETGKKLGIPRSFSEKHIKESSMMVVQVDGRTWNLKCQVRKCSNITKTELASGWRKFVKDNGLQIGDICVFELIKTPKMSFKVTIFPCSEE